MTVMMILSLYDET